MPAVTKLTKQMAAYRRLEKEVVTTDKGSAARIAAALAIISLYVFLFGIMGTIDSIDISISAEDTAPQIQQTDEAVTVPAVTSAVDENGRAIYTYATKINVVNGKKPSLGDYTMTEEMLIISDAVTTTAATSPDDFVMEPEDFDYTTPKKTSAPQTAAPETAATTSETTPVSTETESSTSTTLPPETEDDEGEPYEDDIEDISEEEATEEAETTEEELDDPDITEDEITETAPTEETTKKETEITDNGETLTVNAGGTIVSDSALNIVAQAVMGEIGGGFNEEAIKAQAIAAYTYIKYYNDNNQNAYVVLKTPSDKVLKCVSEVLGKAVYYNGKLIQSVYCASTAGYTASSKSVWGVDYPYLQSRETDFDRLYDINYGRKPTFTSAEMKDYVERNTGIILTGDPSQWFRIESYVDSVYVGKMTIGGYSSFNNGSRDVNITGRVFRETIMEYDIRSASFDIAYDPDSDMFTITTYGYGHGVGLSQHGANILATQYGYTWQQILDFYFPGTYVE